MIKNDRLQSLHILLEVLDNGTQLDRLLQADKELSSLTKIICYGVCRHYFRLQVLADSLVDKRPKDLDLWLVLLIGLYQLQYLDKPEYATVQETVALVNKINKKWAKGLVNAVLRRFCRERTDIMARLEKHGDFISGHPGWFVARVKKDWPASWQMILKANDEHPPMSLRVNLQHLQRDIYLERLFAAGIAASPHAFSQAGIMLESACDVSDLPGFAEGDLSVQDEAAQLAAPLLSLEPGLRVLDVCAAPGGKTCHILELMPELAECVAIDIDERRLLRVHDNLARLGLQATVKTGDALLPSTWWDGQLFDRILLDAPCSATGVIRRHPDIKLLRTENDIQTVVKLQADILASIWPLLRPGGMMVYATCSVMKAENEQQIASFVSKNPDSTCVSGEKPWGIDTGFGWQLLPGQNNNDVFFYSVLIKLLP